MKPIYRTAALVALATAVALGISGNAKAQVLTQVSNTTPSLFTGGDNPSSTNTVSDDLAVQLQATLNQSLDTIPGAAVGIVSPQGTWLGASGLSNLATETAVVPEDRFQIGSITKTFVATTVLQLMEEGTLTLEDTLNEWLSSEIVDTIPNHESITIRQLLNHTSGIYDYTEQLFRNAQNNPTLFFEDWSPEELIAFTYGQEPYFVPGESWQYSNTNYILLGMIAEAATNSTIASEIRSRIVEPLSLNNTFFAEEEEIPGGFVHGYWDFNQNGSLDDVTSVNMSWAWATGAMVSNTQDLARFVQGLLGGELLEPDSLNQMLTFVEPITSNDYSAYGLGIGSSGTSERLWYGHRGLTLAYRSNMWYLPNEGITYIELINTRTNDNLSRPILTALREQEAVASVPEPSVLSGLLAVASAGLLWKQKRRATKIKTTLKSHSTVITEWH